MRDCFVAKNAPRNDARIGDSAWADKAIFLRHLRMVFLSARGAVTLVTTGSSHLPVTVYS